MDVEREFFTAWSCETIESYLLDQDVPDDIIKHNELTEEQHNKLHTLHQQCVDDTPFSINTHSPET